MTEIIVSSLLVGVATSYPLLKWGQKNAAKLEAAEKEWSAKLLAPLLFVTMMVMGMLYAPAYILIVLVLAMLGAVVAVLTTEAIQASRNDSPSTLLASAREESPRNDKVKRWLNGLRGFMLIVAFGVLFGEAVLHDSPHNGLAFRFPEIYSFIGGSRAIPLLKDAVSSEDLSMASSAARAMIELGHKEELVQMGETAAPALSSLLGYTEDRKLYYQAYGERPAFNDGSVRGEAAGALVKIGRPAARPVLKSLYSNNNYYTRWLAAAVLVNIGVGDPDIQSALSAADRMLHSGDDCPICFAMGRRIR